jgi:type IV secretion system protein VirB11
MLRTALGPAITGWLEDPAIVENPDGRLWIDRLAGGLAETGERLSAADGERIVRLVAHHVGAEVHPASPRVSAELPGTGERFERFNALLAEVANTADRVMLIEDTRELQCKAPNLVALRTKDGVASLSDLVRSSLRLRPDRIPIGEVRGSETLDLLKAWGTGHPGGIGTIHAGSAVGALRRLEHSSRKQLLLSHAPSLPRQST